MKNDTPSIRTVTATEARQHWSDVVNEVARGESRILVEKSGLPVVAVVSARDMERLRDYEEQLRERWDALAVFSERFKDIPLEELEAEVDKAVAEVRREQRAEALARPSV
jgi:prevent-host-death family protein